MNLPAGVIINSMTRGVLITIAAVTGFLLLIRFLGPSVARVNRVVTNPITRLFAAWAPGLGIVRHRGRKSGRLYRTPVNVFKVPGGFLIALTYGPNSDWVRNVLAAGGCELETCGRVYRCSASVITHDPSRRRFPWLVRVGLWVGGAADYMHLSTSQASRASA